MRTFIYTVYDNKALVYGTPFFAVTDGSAVRSFSDLVNDANTTVGRHPNDFSLFVVGEYDDQKGLLTPFSPLRHLVDAASLVVQQPELFKGVQDAFFDRARNPNGEAR